MSPDHPLTAAERELWDERIAMVLADHPQDLQTAEAAARSQLLANRARNQARRQAKPA